MRLKRCSQSHRLKGTPLTLPEMRLTRKPYIFTWKLPSLTKMEIFIAGNWLLYKAVSMPCDLGMESWLLVTVLSMKDLGERGYAMVTAG